MFDHVIAALVKYEDRLRTEEAMRVTRRPVRRTPRAHLLDAHFEATLADNLVGRDVEVEP